MEANRILCHQTHCCIMHGCKYRDPDCPVETGQVKQTCVCEDCVEWEDIHTVEELEKIIATTDPEILEKRRALLVGVRGINEMRHMCHDDESWETCHRMLRYLRSVMEREGLPFSSSE